MFPPGDAACQRAVDNITVIILMCRDFNKSIMVSAVCTALLEAYVADDGAVTVSM